MSIKVSPVEGKTKQVSTKYIACYSRNRVTWGKCPFEDFNEALDFLKQLSPEFRYLRINKESVTEQTVYFKQFDLVRPVVEGGEV